MAKKRTRVGVCALIFLTGIIIRFGPSLLSGLSLIGLPGDMQALVAWLAGLRAEGIGLLLIVGALLGLVWVIFGERASRELRLLRGAARSRGATGSVLVRANNPEAAVSVEAIDSKLYGLSALVDTAGRKAIVKLKRTDVSAADDR